MNAPVFYRFRDTEHCIPAMPGYTPPPADWSPLFDRPPNTTGPLVYQVRMFNTQSGQAAWSAWRECTQAHCEQHTGLKMFQTRVLQQVVKR